MKKIRIHKDDVSLYFDAMNGKAGIVCECKHPDSGRTEQCRIDKIHCESGAQYGIIARFDVTILKNNEKILNCSRERILVYDITFENGDYVWSSDGGIFICAGYDNEDYLYYAGLDHRGKLIISETSDDKWCKANSCVRLCTEEEVIELNGALKKEGKFFNTEQKKLVDIFPDKDRGLYDMFIDGCCRFNDSIIPKLKGFWCGDSIVSQRGELRSREAIQECINIYEARMKELTEMCNEIYSKIN